MNENINLCEILKNCPKGTKLYTPLAGEVKLKAVYLNRGNSAHPIEVTYNDKGNSLFFSNEGLYYNFPGAECLLFPSKDQRDWSKFKVKKPKFDPKTLQPFDKVLVRDRENLTWKINMFSHIDNGAEYPCRCLLNPYKHCVPYNDDTKHLLGTKDEAPEYYRYWEY